jgi:hypothetical protein
VGCRQLTKVGFKTYLIDCVNLSELNSETPAGLVSNAIYNATQCGKMSFRMCNLERDSAGLLDGHLRLHKTPVSTQCPNQGYFHSSRVKIGQFDNSTKMVSRCPTFAADLDWFRHRQHSRVIMVA